MSNSEDYLDGLLGSISEAKTNVENAVAREERRRARKVARRTMVDPNDDFMDATGISGYEPRRVSRKNLKEAFSESEFLKDFEDEILGSEDSSEDEFLSDFERDLEREFSDDSEEELLAPENQQDTVEDFPVEESEIDDADFSQEDSVLEDALDDIPAMEEPMEEVSEELSSEETSTDGTMEELPTEEFPVEEDALEEHPVEEAPAEEPLEEAPTEEPLEELPVEELPVEEMTPTEENPKEELPLDLDMSVENPEEEMPLEDDSVDDILSNARMKMEEEPMEESLLQPEYQPDALDAEGEIPVGDLSAEELPLGDLSMEELPLGDDMPNLLDEDGDADLMSLLDGEDADLADIGDLLSADEGGEELAEAREAYEAGADGVSLDSLEEGTTSEEDFSGPFGKIKHFFVNLFKHKDNDEEGNATVDIIENAGPEDLSGENADILKEFEASVDEPPVDPKVAKEEAKKKAKEEKEKKKKEAAAEKEKKKKEAAEAKKRKAEEKAKAKANKPKDNSPKIPLKAFIPFILLGASIVVLVMVATNVLSDHKFINQAKKDYDNGQYVEAYEQISNMTFTDEEDINFQESVHLMAELQLKYDRYQTFMNMEKYDLALDELVNGYGRYSFNAETAAGLGISDSYDALGQSIAQQLQDQFGVTTETAADLYGMHDRKEYTKALIEIVESLGMEVENQYE